MSKNRRSNGDSFDIAIVGGGIIGLSTLFHLSNVHDQSNVILFESGQLGAGSTSKATGGVRNTFTDDLNHQMGQYGLDFYSDFDNNVGGSVNFERDGYLYLFNSSADRESWARRNQIFSDNNVNTEFLDPEDIVDFYPIIDQTKIEGGLYAKDNAFVDPHRIVQGFSDAAREAGCQIRTKTAVTDINIENGAVESINTEDGEYRVTQVINTAGPWARKLCEQVGIELPIELMCRSAVITSPLFEPGGTQPLMIDKNRKFSFRAEKNGSIHVTDRDNDVMNIDNPEGYHSDTVGFDIYSNSLEKLETLVPKALDAEVINGWRGVRCLTPDAHPIVGPTQIENYWIANGFAGHGIMQAPIVGAALSELVLTGKTDILDIDQLKLSRFDSGKTYHEEMEH